MPPSTPPAARVDVHVAKRPRWLAFFPVALAIGDTVVIVVSIVIALMLRRRFGLYTNVPDITDTVKVAAPIILALWLLLIALMSGYRRDLLGVGTEEYQRVFRASIFAASAVGVWSYLVRFQLARGLFLVLFLVGPALLLVWRYAARRLLHQAHRQGHMTHRLLFAGTPAQADAMAAFLNREQWLGYLVVGCLTPEPGEEDVTPGGVPILGAISEAAAVTEEVRADVIVLGSGAFSATTTQALAWDLESLDVEVLLAPGLQQVSSERVRIRPMGSLPLVHVDSPRATAATRWGKRAFDLVLSTVLAVLLSPVMLVIALWIKLDDGGPVLFRQRRVGIEGREFQCLKFRSMVVDAEARLAELQAELGPSDGLFKLKEDPRVTRPGRWLRRFSLDELPQLFNVIGGSMSLVGPRPPLPSEVENYSETTHRRLRVRPGMTGLWQVSGRSDLSWDDSIRLDLYYVDNWSLLVDLSILARTTLAVLTSRGAY